MRLFSRFELNGRTPTRSPSPTGPSRCLGCGKVMPAREWPVFANAERKRGIRPCEGAETVPEWHKGSDLPDLLKASIFAGFGQLFEFECVRCRDTKEGFAGYRLVVPSREGLLDDVLQHYRDHHSGAGPFPLDDLPAFLTREELLSHCRLEREEGCPLPMHFGIVVEDEDARRINDAWVYLRDRPELLDLGQP